MSANAKSTAGGWIRPAPRDPRWVLCGFLGLYVALGHLMLSFNRAPREIAAAIVGCVALDMIYTRLATRRWIVPLSGLISGMGLAILFTAPGNLWLMLLACWLTISSKYLVTWQGRHLFNPTNFALVLILLFSGGRAAIAPAYQWGGSWPVVALVFAAGMLVVHRARKLPLVLSFWAVFAVGALLRARLTHMPAEITLWATVSGGAFMLFSFFMITDPKTSPASTAGQIAFGVGVGLTDICFQLGTAIFSFFYALFAVCALRAAIQIAGDARAARRAPALSTPSHSST